MTKRKAKAAESETISEAAPTVAAPVIQSIKGFNADLSCRGFKFKVGKSYEVEGAIKACANGFHACPTDEHPLSVFGYYPPAGSVFHAVDQSGKTDKADNKIASAKITINAEISLGDLTKRAVEWVLKRAKWSESSVATGVNEGATASGDRGAATASGYQGAATASGRCSHASATGPSGKVRAESNEMSLFAREFDANGNLVSVACGIAGKEGLVAGIWYVCKGGKLIPAK